jgi:hypothetical protein
MIIGPFYLAAHRKAIAKPCPITSGNAANEHRIIRPFFKIQRGILTKNHGRY